MVAVALRNHLLQKSLNKYNAHTIQPTEDGCVEDLSEMQRLPNSAFTVL